MSNGAYAGRGSDLKGAEHAWRGTTSWSRPTHQGFCHRTGSLAGRGRERLAQVDEDLAGRVDAGRVLDQPGAIRGICLVAARVGELLVSAPNQLALPGPAGCRGPKGQPAPGVVATEML